MMNAVLGGGLWLILTLLVAATGRFFYTALADPEKAADGDPHESDFRGFKIPYYFAVWAGLGLIVFFAVDGILLRVPEAFGLTLFAVWPHVALALAVGLGFSGIVLINQISVVRAVLSARNKALVEADTLRDRIRDLVADLDHAAGAGPRDIEAAFLRVTVDLELSSNGLSVEDRALARGILGLARRGASAMHQPGMRGA